MSVLLETSLGEIVIDLETEKVPKTCLNFLKLCKAKYYNFVLFHSVQQGFVAQTGDPSGTGTGGESVWGLIDGASKKYFEPEIHPKLQHKGKGVVSMALVPSTDSRKLAGSQFIITLSDSHLDYLDGRQAVFGQVAEGMETLDKINEAMCDGDGRPYRDIRIRHTVVLDDPFDDPKGLVVPDRSPIPTEMLLETSRIGEDEEIGPAPGTTAEDLERMEKKEAADARALTLEIIGDLPFADIKPPENVLFVCKLNPVTREEDLEVIFSRFGKILSCEVIRDKKTNESLSYAFIEFENKDECEEAYFKMDNVLIDDRRIHVDFSQSVSKLHRDFLMGKRAPMEDYGIGLQKRQKYRDASSNERHGKDYELVFDHGGDLEEEKGVHKRDQRHRDVDGGDGGLVKASSVVVRTGRVTADGSASMSRKRDREWESGRDRDRHREDHRHRDERRRREDGHSRDDHRRREDNHSRDRRRDSDRDQVDKRRDGHRDRDRRPR